MSSTGQISCRTNLRGITLALEIRPDAFVQVMLMGSGEFSERGGSSICQEQGFREHQGAQLCKAKA